jgi:hypothetical protein
VSVPGKKLQPPDFEWVAQVSTLGFAEVRCARRNARVPHAATAGKTSVLPAVSAPSFALFAKGGISRMCGEGASGVEQLYPTLRKKREGWGTRSLVRGTEKRSCGRRNPGLKSETWATHSNLVRAIFVFVSASIDTPKSGAAAKYRNSLHGL